MNRLAFGKRWLLTARYFFEVGKFGVGSQGVTGGCVAVEVASSQPWIVVSSKTVGRGGTRFYTRLQSLHFAKQLGTACYMHPTINGDDLL